MISDSDYEDLDGIEEKLHTLTASIEESIDIWKRYIANAGNKNYTQARRTLARSYLKMADREADSENYYRFILKFIQAIDGSTLAEEDLPRLLRGLKQRAANKYNRTIPQHWFSKNSKGINALVTNSRNRRNAIPGDEMVETLFPLVGRISNNYVNDSHAYINWHGVEVYFNPFATKGEIGITNIGQRVKFGLGFSYDGPRAYNSSIKLLGKDEFVEVRRKIESGIVVKCEVTKNVEYYVQVRIIGFTEIGSIHINELALPYSADNRPRIGIIFEGRVLMNRFDNAKHCEIWQITMNIDNVKEDEVEETTMARAIRLSGIKIK